MGSGKKCYIEEKEQTKLSSPRKQFLEKTRTEKNGKALTKPLEKIIASETESKKKTTGGSVCRKSGIAEAKIQLKNKLSQEYSKSPTA